jgi:hypothetical protein
MGRGDRPVRRWKNDRIRAKRARIRRKAEDARAAAAERPAPTETAGQPAR